jgi:uncharacterized protein (TIGR00251 family)
MKRVERRDEGRLTVRLKPRAKNDRIKMLQDGTVDMAVTSPPVDGRANEHLIDLLADRLGVPKRSVSIVVGGHSRNKVVRVEGLTKEEVITALKG